MQSIMLKSDKRVPAQTRRSRLTGEDRRRRLVEATLRSLARHGARGTSLRRVARELEVAPSLINHFFSGWEDLLLSAYRLLAERALCEYEEIATAKGLDPRERLRMVIKRNVAAEWLADEMVGAHIALWDLSRTMPALKSAFTRYHRRRRQLVSALFARLVGERRASGPTAMAAAGFVIFLDGVWLELGLSPGNIPRRQAVAMCESWVDTHFPERGS